MVNTKMTTIDKKMYAAYQRAN
ncbi:unnamed protein product [Acanthoscelides obtectus]|uniref:Uncharacterized protein n=1 Tax=Acanthoscelides obtectus TaxID=200917 RepID=A0A9P0PTD5_ACAOB|nr:unnamed protein product [Acanthoscelides obtectus]CAK1667078.1 hypothetical protein AOBTE_LOCUS25667 [Acanthoscelides obtectus]